MIICFACARRYYICKLWNVATSVVIYRFLIRQSWLRFLVVYAIPISEYAREKDIRVLAGLVETVHAINELVHYLRI